MVTEATVESQPADVAEERPAVVNRRWTVGEYHAMAKAGILKKEDRVELIYRTPSPKSYKKAQFLSKGDTVEVEALADAGPIALNDLFR